jgi:polysaccharide biosynthesis transport protein
MTMSTTKREAPETESHDDLMRFLSIFWERKMIVLLGLVVGMLVGTLYYVRARPVFQSSARVLIIKKSSDLLSANDPRGAFYEDYVGNQQVLIRSPSVLKKLVEDTEFEKLHSFSKNPQKAIDQISASLSVVRGADKDREGATSTSLAGGSSNVLTFLYRGSNAEDCTLVVHLLLKVYQEYLAETFTDYSKETLRLIEKAKDAQENLLKEKQDKHQEFVTKHPLVAMNRAKNKDGFAAVTMQYAAYQDNLTALNLRKMEIQSHLESLKRAEDQGLKREVRISMIDRFERRATDQFRSGGQAVNVADLDAILTQLLIKKADLSTRFGPDQQEMQTLVNNIEEVKKLIAKRNEGWNNGPGSNDLITTHTEALLQEIQDIDGKIVNLSKLMDKEQDSVKENLSNVLELARLETDIHDAEAFRQNIVDQLAKLDISKESGGYEAAVLNHPSMAVQVEPKAYLTFSIAAIAGILMGLGLAYLSDMTDRSFRTPVDISRSLKLAVVGHVPVMSGKIPADQEGTKLSPFLCTHFRPKSRDAEAFREIRTALYFNTRNTNCRKIQITSAASGDGKSTMASNIAISIAQSGKRVLLVDCDLRRPRIHTIFGLGNEIGFSTVLTDNAEPSEVTFAEVVPGLSVIPAGPNLPNPAEVLTSARFNDCANMLAEKYDFVLFDTPPLLAVTDPAVIAPRMDGVFLVVRLGKRERSLAERSAEILRTLEANVIGVVVNAIGQDGMGYGRYGRYYYGRYSYYYGSGGYRYNKGYRYGNDGYYTEEGDKNESLPAVVAASNGHKSNPSGESNGETANGEQSAQTGTIKRAFRWFLGD